MNELKGGLLLVACDDPGPLTSPNEEDSRHFAKIAQVPLLEPSTAQEAKDMTKWLLEFSEQIGVPGILRSVNRLSHGRGGVTLEEIHKREVTPYFDIHNPLVGLPPLVRINHGILLKKMKKTQRVFDKSPFNIYYGPREARFLIMATGLGVLYAQEAVNMLNLDSEIGILKIGTTWPLPSGLIKNHLKDSDAVLFVEEVDPFLEDQVKVIYAENYNDLGTVKFYGKNTGDIYGDQGPGVGEMNTDIALGALQKIFKIRKNKKAKYKRSSKDEAGKHLVPREISFCHGCPHRASFFAINSALERDGRKGFVVGDIGCYGLGVGATGFNQIKVLHCMGSGMGNASGFSKMASFGFDQPVVAVAGDSTFFHACLPALVNAKFNEADALFVVLDNSVTAMTGFQENPASPFDHFGQTKSPVLTEEIAKSLGVKVTVMDPVKNINKAIDTVYENLQEEGVKVIVFRRVCATFEARTQPPDQLQRRARVNPEKCVGEEGGCDRFCSRILGCPGIHYDKEKDKAYIQEDSCNGCGLCVQLCPERAISLYVKRER
jgi:indolepyruvate ferredoxin oxidoreductase alpha subunit